MIQMVPLEALVPPCAYGAVLALLLQGSRSIESPNLRNLTLLELELLRGQQLIKETSAVNCGSALKNLGIVYDQQVLEL